MPKLTEASRQRRREQITTAALRCVARQGFAATSIADIVEESGLSAGSIYSHFESKAELVRLVAGDILRVAIDAIAAGSPAPGGIVTPSELFLRIVDGVFDPDLAGVLLDVWTAVPHDPELAEIARGNLRAIENAMVEVLTPWAVAQADGKRADARQLVQRSVDAVIACSQGYAVRRVLDAEIDAGALRRSLATSLDQLAVARA